MALRPMSLRPMKLCLALAAVGLVAAFAGSASATSITYDVNVDLADRSALGVSGAFTGSFTADVGQNSPSSFSLNMGGETWECAGADCGSVGRRGRPLALEWSGDQVTALSVPGFSSDGGASLSLYSSLTGSVSGSGTTSLDYSLSEQASSPSTPPDPPPGTHTPEPSAALLFGIGALTFGAAMRRRRR